jgi:hypothetical protein
MSLNGYTNMHDLEWRLETYELYNHMGIGNAIIVQTGCTKIYELYNHMGIGNAITMQMGHINT